jgi:hypothetical protein
MPLKINATLCLNKAAHPEVRNDAVTAYVTAMHRNAIM